MTAPSFPRPTSKSTSGGEVLAGCLMVIVMAPFTFVMAGVTLMYLWNWFVVPPTHFAELTFWSAVGMSVVAEVFKQGLSTYKEKDDDGTFLGKIVTLCLTGFFTYAFILFEGWIIHNYLI